MKFALRPQHTVFLLLLAALQGPGKATAATPLISRPAVTLTAFDEGRADGNAYRVAVQRAPNAKEMIGQQVAAAQSAAAANPAAAQYFQGYVAGLEPSRELTTTLNARQ